MTQIINPNKSPNYISDDNSIYILGDFEHKTMSELIGHISTMIRQLPTEPIYKANQKIVSPYDAFAVSNPIIDIFIDSNGGDTNMLNDISTLLNIAKMRGAIIRTTVLSRAYSCGSLLAIQGTPGFRIMSHCAQHMIHFGSFGVQADSEKMAKHILENALRKKEITHDRYKTYTKMSPKDIKRLTTSEGEYWDAQKCLNNGLCDWIIGENGKLIGRGQR